MTIPQSPPTLSPNPPHQYFQGHISSKLSLDIHRMFDQPAGIVHVAAVQELPF